MRTKDGFMLRKLGNQYVVAAVGKASEEFKGIIRLNKAGAFLWEKLSKENETEESLIEAILSHYEIDEKTAKNDVKEFVKTLEDAQLLREQ